MGKWKCCTSEPPETGKKVLCQKDGDLYVAMRLKNYYLPISFLDHYNCIELAKPETWSEIDFPENLTGHTTVALNENNWQLITLSQLEVDFPEHFEEISQFLIDQLGTLKNPKKQNE